MKHIHLNELPGWMARKGSDTQVYAYEALNALAALDYTHEKVLMSANKAEFMISQINSKAGLTQEPREVYSAIQNFTYHYENYCLRAYIFREKILLFINASLKLGFKVGDVNLKSISIQPTVKTAHLLPVIEAFDSSKKGALGKIISHRKKITHKQYYASQDPYFRPEEEIKNEEQFYTWCRKWRKNIKDKAKEIDNATYQCASLHHKLAANVLEFREKNRT